MDNFYAMNYLRPAVLGHPKSTLDLLDDVGCTQ